ncbi:MAG: sialidase family protein [Porphyromonas sp.]|nr:sialidase family protein [Porphyromonas sp.]
MKKRLILLVGLCLFGLKTDLNGQTPDTLYVHYSNHGTAMGKEMQTLCKLYVKPAEKLPKSATLALSLVDMSDKPLSQIVAYSSSVDRIRDIVDYKTSTPIKALNKPLSGGGGIALKFRFKDRDLTNGLIYLTAKVNPNASEGSFVRSEIRSALLNGKQMVIKSINESERKVFKAYTTLWAPGDYNSKNYRIPAIITTKKGTIVAVADKRKANIIDLPEDIDIVVKRSTDNGNTWSEPILVVEGQGRFKGYGDAAIVETKSGKLLMVYVGGTGLWQSRPNDPNRTYISESTDDGITWSAPRDITSQLFGDENNNEMRKHWWASFCASGNGCVTKDGRILFAAAVREGKTGSLNNYAYYSDDEGKTWKVSGPAMMGGDESKIIELKDGRLLMSIRNKFKGKRYYNISQDGGQTWGTPGQWSEILEPACNGAIMRYKHESRPEIEFLLHSIPFDKQGRRNGTIFISDDEGKTWKWNKNIFKGSTAYTDLTILPDGDIGYFTEEDEPISLVFVKISPEWLFEEVTKK